MSFVTFAYVGGIYVSYHTGRITQDGSGDND